MNQPFNLLPPVPQGLSIAPLTRLTIGDLDLSSFFEVRGPVVALRPEVIELFQQFLPMMQWVAESVKRLLENQEAAKVSDDKNAARELENFIDHMVKTLNERIPAACSGIVLKKLYADKPHALALFGNEIISGDDRMREVAGRAINTAIKMGIIKSKRKLADDCDVNPGQLSNFVRMNGPMSIDKVIECLDCIAKEAEKFGRLEELKNMVFSKSDSKDHIR